MKIVILTGAGISKESGIPTFRDGNGLWDNHNVDEVATSQAFINNPKKVLSFFQDRLNQMQSCEPNIAHHTIKKFEKKFDNVIIITQNIDNLHEQAKSKNVIHMHGNIFENKCLNCGHVQSINDEKHCIFCHSVDFRPNVVLFDEMPHHLEEILMHLSECDLFLSIGTSDAVYPAANFAQHVKSNGVKTVCFNLEKTPNNPYFDKFIQGKVSETLPIFLRNLEVKNDKIFL